MRSSYAFEDVVTEFDIQGLEIDYSIVAWDADYRYVNGKWEHYNFKGTRWNSVRAPERILYLKNTYRVLLTRARQGMAIYIPQGDITDKTRQPEFYDGIYNFLRAVGVPEI